MVMEIPTVKTIPHKLIKLANELAGFLNIWPTVLVALSQFHVQLMSACADSSGAALMQTTTL
jgi:hypothetical protein